MVLSLKLFMLSDLFLRFKCILANCKHMYTQCLCFSWNSLNIVSWIHFDLYFDLKQISVSWQCLIKEFSAFTAPYKVVFLQAVAAGVCAEFHGKQGLKLGPDQ